MKKYIDADALGIGKADRNVFTIPEYADGWNSAIEIIENAPTADVAEVRHGHWIERIEKPSWLEDDVEVYYDCSECGTSHWSIIPPYCPECGAKMDGGNKG